MARANDTEAMSWPANETGAMSMARNARGAGWMSSKEHAAVNQLLALLEAR